MSWSPSNTVFLERTIRDDILPEAVTSTDTYQHNEVDDRDDYS